MTRLLTLLVFVLALLGAGKALAQPTVYVFPDFVQIDAGDETCVEFRTVDFTDIQEMRFSVRWDPEAVTLTNIPVGSLNASMPNLDIGDFTFDNVEGYLIFTWKIEDVPGCPGTAVTLPDEDVLFELCFQGITGYSEITITDDPEPVYVTRLNSCPQNIGLFMGGGFIAVDNKPITINVPFASGNEGEVVCIDLSVEDFIDIISMQFTIQWSPQVLEFQSIQGVGLPWPGTSFNPIPPQGICTVSWFNNLNPSEGFTVPDGTDIIQICFTIVGSCGQSSLIEIVDEPTPIEVTNESDPGKDIGVYKGEGEISVNCINPNGLTIMIPDVDICPGESFCMDVTTENFTDIVGFEYSIGWNPNIIQFQGIQNINTDLFLFNMSSFNTAGSNNGRITVDWSDPSCLGEDLPDGTVLYTLCFASVGGGGVNTTVSIVNNPLDIEIIDQCAGNNIGLNSFNGLVDVCSPPGITLIAETTEVDPGQDICIQIEVQEFDDVQDMAFTLIWETGVLQYNGVQGFGLPGLSAANFDEANTLFGALCVDWSAMAVDGETLPDGSVLFEVCFTAVGDPFSCSEITFLEFPCNIDVITAASNGFNVGVNAVPGEVCVTNPFNFALTVSDANGAPGSVVCVDVAVQNFVSLESAQFSINFDPSVLDYQNLVNTFNLPNFGLSSYSDNNAGVGVITVDWDANNPNGASLGNGTVIFQLCFELVGDPGECSPVDITGTPSSIEVIPANSGGINIGLISEDGEVCTSQVLTLVNSVVTPVACPGDNTGAIDIAIQGGSGSYSYNWSGPGVVPPAEDQLGLTNTTYSVTITDNIFNGLQLVESITVGISAQAPVADAGEELTISCGNISIELDGSGSSQGAQYSYLWTNLGAGLVDPDEETTLTPTVVGADLYVLSVTDNSTSCTVTDTVMVNAASTPGAVVASLDVVTCSQDSVWVSGQGSTIGNAIAYSWSGPSVVAATSDSIFAQVTEPGWYFLTVTNTLSGCMIVDSIQVMADTISPNAVAGTSQMIDCDNNTALLDGAGSSVGPNFTYEWFDPQFTFLSDQITATASEPGTHQLIVTNTDNGCFSISEVEVQADTLLPNANATALSPITCTTDQVTISANGSSTNGNYTYTWTGPGVLPGTENSFDATATVQGAYTLTVLNTDNGCEAISVATVMLDTVPPTAVAAAPDSLGCSTDPVALLGTGSSTGAPGAFSYLWTGPEVVAGTQTLLNAQAAQPGLYTLQVTQTSNGCVASVEVEVADNSVFPDAVIADPAQLDCNNDFIVLDASASSSGPEYTYVWSGPFCININPPNMPTVGCTGTFTLTVVNTNNGCSSTTSVTVTEDSVEPVANALGGVFNCFSDEVTLNATGSSTGNQYTYTWSVLSGGATISDPSAFSPNVNGPGSFGLVVTDTTNGCFATDFAVVTADTLSPTANAGTDGTIDCDAASVVLNGLGSSQGVNITYEWTLNGQFVSDQAVVEVEEGGTYVLTVTNNSNGCSSTDEAIVTDLADVPVADAGPASVDLTCLDAAVVLDGTGSEVGPDIAYQWTAISGLLDPGTVNQPSAIAQEGGVYVLTVTNSLSGCSATDTVTVNAIIGLDDAEAVFEGDECSVEGFLLGNQPENTTGMWTASGGAVIDSPEDFETFVSNLGPGTNILTWTLSGPNCPDYSSAEVQVLIEGLPVANNDNEIISGNDDSIEINLLDNDITFGVDNFTLTIISQPVSGTITDPVDGNLTYTVSPLFSGEVIFEYVLCNTICTNLCDTATVRITVDRDINPDDTVPNGITPNGDGINDGLVFDILLEDPTKYPDNEIVIFNRWGDIVFQQGPYENAWMGTDNSGNELPAGTYYYILRLDVAESEIIRGDVTIVK